MAPDPSTTPRNGATTPPPAPNQPPAPAPGLDRRVQRSRAALIAAAVTLVSERGTTSITISEIAQTADVSRRLVYVHFHNRDALLVAAALDLIHREPLPPPQTDPRATPSHLHAVAAVLARHRPFYRALLTGPCAHATTTALVNQFTAWNAPTIRTHFGDPDPDTTADLTTFLTAGGAAILTNWLTHGSDPLDPTHLSERIARIGKTLAAHRPC